jgi:hypothetical protein
MAVSYCCITGQGLNTGQSVVAVLPGTVLASAPVIFAPVEFAVELT